MTTNAGIWIDHHNAVVVLLTDRVETTKIIFEDAEETKAPGYRSNDRNEHTRNDFLAEDDLERNAMIH